MTRLLIIVLWRGLLCGGLVGLPLTACDADSSGGGGSLTADQAELQALSTSLSEQTRQGAVAQQGALDAISVASSGFTVDLATQPAPAHVVDSFDIALEGTLNEHAGWVVGGFEFADDATPLATGTLTSFMVIDPETQWAYAQGSQDFLLTSALIVGSVALAGWGAYKGVKKAVDTRAAPVKNKIAAANQAELGVINQSLGLPADTPKDQTASHFDNLGVGSKLTKAKGVEQDLRIAVVDGTPGVNDVDAVSINTSVANSSVELGKTAVTTTVSLSTTATGGQGYSQALETVGVAKNTAAVVDFGISAVSTATETPLQPLDIMASHVDVAAASKSTKTVTVPAPVVSMTVADAKAALQSPQSSTTDIDVAADTVAMAAINQNAMALAPMTNADGSVTVSVSNQVHLAEVNNPTNHTTIKLPDMGPADVLIIAEGHTPQLVENINTTTEPVIGYPDELLEDHDPDAAAASQYSLLVWASPADPAAYQDVNVTAQITPADSGVTVSMSVSGSDGYSNAIDAYTDTLGQATLWIPGAEEGVTDVVTVELPSQGTRQIVSYAF